MLLIGACSSRGTLREMNLILQCDKYFTLGLKTGDWDVKPRKITLSRRIEFFNWTI